MRIILIISLATLLCLKVALTASKNDDDKKKTLPGVGVITQPILQAVTLNHPNYRNDLAKNKASIKILKDDSSEEEDDGGEENSNEKRDSNDHDSDDDDGDDDENSEGDDDDDDDDNDSDGDKKNAEDNKKSGEDKKIKDDDDSKDRKSKAIKNKRDTGTRDKSPLCILFGGYGPKTKNWY